MRAGSGLVSRPRPALNMARGRPCNQWPATVGLYALSLAVALGLAAALVQVTGSSPAAAFAALYQGSLQGGTSLTTTLDETTPLLLVALGAIICTRAGIFNIGQDGQLTFGTMVATVVALKVPGSSWLILPFTLISGAIGGAFWAGISAVLRYWRGVDVVLSTLLMTFVAFQIVSYAVDQDWFLRESSIKGEITVPASNPIPDGLHLARLGDSQGFNISIGAAIGVILAILVGFALARTSWGFHLRLLGLNRVVAHRCGISEARTGGTALLLSGAFAGLAGGVILTATAFRVQAGFSNNVGTQGLLVALVAQGSVAAAVPVALFFGALRSGGGFLASTGVPRYLVDVLQSFLVLAAVLPATLLALRQSGQKPVPDRQEIVAA